MPCHRVGWRHRRSRRVGWVLLETVIASGLLVAGLAVIGAQVQDAETSVRKMERRVRAFALAELQLASMDLGLVELDSVDFVQEEDFGPRYPDFGWVLTTEQTAVDDLYQLKLEILYLLRDEEYEPDSFEHDLADTVITVYAFRATAQPLDFVADFGLSDDEVDDLENRLKEAGIDIDPRAWSPGDWLNKPFEEYLDLLPLLEAMGVDLDQLAANLPPGILDALKSSGVLESEGEPTGDGGS